MRIAQFLTVALISLAMVSTASAERRPGLGGKYSARNMTAAQGSLLVIAGPKTTQNLGAPMLDGGIQYTNLPDFDVLGESLSFDTIHATIGAAYGITPELEAGLMLPVLLSAGDADDFDALSTLPLFVTYAKDMGNFDIGGRLTFDVPIEDQGGTSLSAGIPILYRMGNARIDAGLFFPVFMPEEGDTAISLNIPVRFAQSVTPKIFVGVETGLYLPDMETDAGQIPLSLFGGYTLLAGGNVIDLGLSVGFPGFISMVEDAENPGTDIMTVNVGANVQMAF